MPNIDDNRETCSQLITSSCVPYTGYVSDTVKDNLPCRPNVNDIIYQLQLIVDGLKADLGNIHSIIPGCIDGLTTLSTQAQTNQALVTKICSLQQQIANLSTINPNTLMIAIDLLCLIDPSCTPAASYSLNDIITKLVTAYCNLLTRVTNIETILNI